MSQHIRSGQPHPLGATVHQGGVNFALFCRNGSSVVLELYRNANETVPQASFALDPVQHRTGDIWHIFVEGLEAGQLYGYRVDGPYQPEQGHRFNRNKLLLDPYARGIAGQWNARSDSVYGYNRKSAELDLSFDDSDSAGHVPRSVVLDPVFDWENVRRPKVPWDQTVLYEVHVKGLTADPVAQVNHPGTYLGLTEKIDHLKQLGVTTIELLPVHEFDPYELRANGPTAELELTNYWGYSTLSFFAPHRFYASDPQQALAEFKQMVKQLHQAGIEVILDVVYNHTGEGDERGPTYSYRGLDNAIYYALEGGRHYRNYSGCGNTLDCDHPVVRRLVLDSLRYWFTELKVDGFRFDLATVLGRGPHGEWRANRGLLRQIGEDPLLRGAKLIAEPWDAGGLYQVGQLPTPFAEWNGRFRDDVRRFVRGDRGQVAELARRLGGSSDLFSRKASASASVNFVTCHDGFTLRDLVSYAQKHNLANAEDNRDGATENYSHNWGSEGESDDATVRQLRRQQAKNLLTILFLSRGTPMLLAGDELWQTQQGNNNAYCHDTSLTWLDWRDSDEAAEIQRFVTQLVNLRRRYAPFFGPEMIDPFGSMERSPIKWHGIQPDHPDWSYHSHSLAVQMRAPEEDRSEMLYLILNAWSEPLRFKLPQLETPQHWFRIIDTALPSPEDHLEDETAVEVTSDEYRCSGRSSVLLIGKRR